MTKICQTKLDKPNYNNDYENFENAYVEPEVYKEEVDNEEYECMHEIFFIISESNKRRELLRKTELFCRMLLEATEGEEEYLKIILLRLGGKSLREIGEIMQTNPSNINVKLSRIKNKNLILALKILNKINKVSLSTPYKYKRLDE